jgi:hypothetical protein
VRDTIHGTWCPIARCTNGAVTQQVQKVEGNTLQVKYKDGEKTIVVPSNAEVVNLVAGDKSDLKAGAHVFIPRAWRSRPMAHGRRPSSLLVAMGSRRRCNALRLSQE